MKELIRKLFAKPSHTELAQRELDDAQRDLLTAQACREHYQHTERMLFDRINRLKATLSTERTGV